jgi:hypothetical protein
MASMGSAGCGVSAIYPVRFKTEGVRMMRCRRGDAVIARQEIEGRDRPRVPAGSRGTVVTTTMLGRPKKVFFAVSDGWGLKRFEVMVNRGDVDAAQRDAETSAGQGRRADT